MYERPMNIAFLSTYPPRECGLATFTQDLIFQMGNMKSTRQSRIVAVSNESLDYDDIVLMELKQNDRESYFKTASRLNNSKVELLVIEHEFGIYGGDRGEYLLDLIENLQMPFVTTLHTVLPTPDGKQRHILNTLGKKGEKIITMARNSVEILINVYGIDPYKIEVINHGVPYIPMKSREALKEDHGLGSRSVISTFGLLGPGKGLEYGIEAIAKVAKTHKDVLYFILGQTHPSIKKDSGENYRNALVRMVKELKIEDNVMFIDKYLNKEEIVRYLKMSDIYMTPYLSKDQAVSGTLAYAVGCGRLVVSTPYSYAREMLSEGRGLLTKFKDYESIAECIEYVLDNPDEKKKMEDATDEMGKTMMWDQVAQQYKELFSDVLAKFKLSEAADRKMVATI